MVTSQFLGKFSGAFGISLFFGATLSLGMWFTKFRRKPNFVLWVYTERYVISGRIPETPVIQFTA